MNDVRKVVGELIGKLRHRSDEYIEHSQVLAAECARDCADDIAAILATMPADGELIVKPAIDMDSPEQVAITEKWESGELGQSAEHARVVKPSHSPEVVAWRFVNPKFGGFVWTGGAPHQEAVATGNEPGWGIELAYSQPAAQVPDYIVRACERYLEIHERYVSDETRDRIRDWLKSIGGAK